jgi:aspartyl-tRNA(Asn)/glutamyl-tRNA(Gln) amidotransferase subunit A
VSGADYAASVQRMYEWRQDTRRVFERVDLVLVPTASGVAPKIQEAETVATTAHLGRFTYSLSLAAIPVMALPCGITAKGLPVGFQIAAHAWQESVLLRAAAAYQSVTDWHRRRPPALRQGTS